MTDYTLISRLLSYAHNHPPPLSLLLLSSLSLSLPGPRLLLCCHVDVLSDHQPDDVPLSNPHDTSGDVQSDTHTPRISGDVLYGRGAADMKGGVASALQIFADFASQVMKLLMSALLSFPFSCLSLPPLLSHFSPSPSPSLSRSFSHMHVSCVVVNSQVS